MFVVAVFFIGLGHLGAALAAVVLRPARDYPPYNKHLFHDVGAFQVGIGSTLLFALFRRDALQVALIGTSVGAVLHAISHIVDRDLGGKSTDPFLLSALALVIVLATAAHMSQRQR